MKAGDVMNFFKAVEKIQKSAKTWQDGGLMSGLYLIRLMGDAIYMVANNGHEMIWEKLDTQYFPEELLKQADKEGYLPCKILANDMKVGMDVMKAKKVKADFTIFLEKFDKDAVTFGTQAGEHSFAIQTGQQVMYDAESLDRTYKYLFLLEDDDPNHKYKGVPTGVVLVNGESLAEVFHWVYGHANKPSAIFMEMYERWNGEEFGWERNHIKLSPDGEGDYGAVCMMIRSQGTKHEEDEED